MLRVLLCVTCCSVPPKERAATKRKPSAVSKSSGDSPKQAEKKSATSSEQLASSSEVAIEKDHLLSNQIQTNNENFGSSKSSAEATAAAVSNQQQQQPEDNDQSRDEDSVAAGSALATGLKRQDAVEDENHPPGRSGTGDQVYDEGDTSELVRARRQALLAGAPFDGPSVSPASSIEIDQYTEGSSKLRPPGASFDDYETQVAAAAARRDGNPIEQSGDRQAEYSAALNEQSTFVSSVGSAPSARNVPSKTKIGDYARIEYSPVEDLDSVTTMSYSRGGSERGPRSQAGSLLSRQNSLKATTFNADNVSHRSSQGIESTSISIASQLSNEQQLQQKLTNMLESVNAPYPLFGTIGLPLGPPLEGTYTETAKTSPETPGAALTSASQDSLSDTSIGSPKLNRQATLRSNASSTGAALVGDSTERSPFDESADFNQAPLASGEDELKEDTKRASENTPPSQRIGSPQSYATTTSTGLTNPTPTPSELSTSSGKKKKLKAKSFLKRLKPGSKKKNKDE